MKKVFWIFTACVCLLTNAFGQDDSYYPNNYDQSIPPAKNNADNDQNIPHTDYNVNSNSNNNDQPNYRATDNTNSNQPANSNSYDQTSNQYAANDNGDDYANYQNFHNLLSPYGNWVNYPGYGNVWVPNQVPADFSPYATAGHWVYTTYGWSWVSDYGWGRIPFHYGRWFRDNVYGWMWMPGYQWAPAWVTWGNYNNYYCWAPLAPYIGFSAYYRPNPFYWNFCDRAHFCDFHLGLYRGFYGRGDYRGIAARINVINEWHRYGCHAYFAGPRVNEVEHAVGHSISAVNGYHGSQGMAAHNVNGQFHQPGGMNQYRGQSFANHNNVQTNHFANNNMQSKANAQQNNGRNYSAKRANNGVQYHIQAQQHYENRVAQSYRAPQRGYQHNQPVQRQSERSFASAKRPPSSHGSPRSGGGGSHGGRR